MNRKAFTGTLQTRSARSGRATDRSSPSTDEGAARRGLEKTEDRGRGGGGECVGFGTTDSPSHAVSPGCDTGNIKKEQQAALGCEDQLLVHVAVKKRKDLFEHHVKGALQAPKAGHHVAALAKSRAPAHRSQRCGQLSGGGCRAALGRRRTVVQEQGGRRLRACICPSGGNAGGCRGCSGCSGGSTA